jgi:hypothetical protein
MAMSVSQALIRQFPESRNILHSLQLSKVGSLVTVRTPRGNVRMPISVRAVSEQLSEHQPQ